LVVGVAAVGLLLGGIAAVSAGLGSWKRLSLTIAGAAVAASVLLASVFAPVASAAPTMSLGTTLGPFAILAATGITETAINNTISGDVGVTPDAGTTDHLNNSEVTGGTIYSVDSSGPDGVAGDNPGLLTTASTQLTAAVGEAASATPVTTAFGTSTLLGGLTLTAGVYSFGGPPYNIPNNGKLVLNGEGNPNATFIFQGSSSLILGTNSVVQLENDAQACNVYWEVGSKAVLGTGSVFVGTLMAGTSITLGSGANVQGRLLAETGDVTLIKDTINAPTTCLTSVPTTTTTTTSPSLSGTPSTTGSGTGVGTGVIPSGAPATGQGGASLAGDGWLIATGVVALAGAGVATVLGVRRRHTPPVVDGRTKVE
jgi:hypothetical protein